MQRQSGSALVEFIIVSAVLIPIMFGIPMIGKIIDLKQTTVQASRYSAWETTVSDQSAQNLDQRFFSDASAPIGNADIGPNTLWGPVETPTNTNDTTIQANAESSNPAEPLTGYPADTLVEVMPGAIVSDSSVYQPGVKNSIQYAPAVGEGAAQKVGRAVEVVGGALKSKLFDSGGSWNMEFDGLIRGEASVQMQGNGWLDPLTIKQGTVIMQDNWSAGEAVHARDRVRSLVPGGVLAPVGEVLGTIGQVPLLRELKYFQGNSGRRVFGHVDMQPLPPSEDVGPRPLKEYVE